MDDNDITRVSEFKSGRSCGKEDSGCEVEMKLQMKDIEGEDEVD